MSRSSVLQGWEIEPFIYRIGDPKPGVHINPGSILQAVCEERGWKEYGPEEERCLNGSVLGWNLWWKTVFSTAPQRSIYSWQYVNYIPRAIGFCNKEYLARFVNYMHARYGEIFDFCPTTFILPEDLWKLEAEHNRRSQLHEGSLFAWGERARNLIRVEPGLHELESIQTERPVPPKTFQPAWISKPIGKSQGKGIIILNDTSSLTLCESISVVQEYIARPLLISGHKFDLRLYVFVPSTMPLTVYIYDEGLTRFAVEKYDIKCLSSNFSHLTNASLNKLSPAYDVDKECLGIGCKWTLRRLRQYLQSQNRRDWFMWQRIVSIIVLTLVGESVKAGALPHCRNCFEFLGYDILLDDDLRPWLLEVNHSPGLNADCKVDHDVKNPLLHDLFNLLGLPNHGEKKSPDSRFSVSEFMRVQSAISRPNSAAPIAIKELLSSDIQQKLRMKQSPNQERDSAKQSLRCRLIELTAVYSQSMTPFNLKPKQKAKKKWKSGSPPTSQRSSKSEEDESASSKSKRTIKVRDWVHPIKKCGGWVRVFPFDELTHQQSRGKVALDTQLLINHIYSILKKARECSLGHPTQTDEAYAAIFKAEANLTTEVWIPPIAYQN